MTTESKSVVNQELILAARKGLVPVHESARLGGFGNMFRKELGQWWGTRTWLVQTLIWVLILNGITTIIMLDPLESGQLLQEVVQTFLPMSMVAIGIGTIITVQGAIVGEKQLGTAAWVLSKPATRSAFILAKALAYVLSYGITAIAIPSIIFLITLRQLVPASLAWAPFLSGVALVILSQLFYLALTLMLGTLFSSRGPIAGIGIGFILSGLLLKGLFPLEVLALTPWLLPDLSGAIALEMPLPSIWFVPILATASCTAVMITVALWRFGREEF